MPQYPISQYTHALEYNPGVSVPDLPPVFTPGIALELISALNDTASTGFKSIEFTFHRQAHFPNVCSVEFKFGGDPGAFELDFETSDTNAEASFVKKAALTTGLNASYAGRMEIANIVAKYGRLNLVLLTNGVTLEATVQ